MLNFLGRGSAFADEQNCAFFAADDTLVLLDCPMSAFHRLRKSDIPQKQIVILVTHTHSDHVGGIPMLIHFSRFLQKHVTVAAPSAEIAKDLEYLIGRLDGCDRNAYTVTTAEALQAPWLRGVIPVQHADGLDGRCFGYRLQIGGNDVIYTGDTRELEPFLPYLHGGAYLYTETSAFDSGVHLYIDTLLPQLRKLVDAGVHVYLMHLDDEKAIAEKTAGSGVTFAPLTDRISG